MSSLTLLAHVALLLALAAPQKPSASRNGDLFSQIFQKSVARQKTMKSIRGNFTETTTSSLLVKPIVSKGTIIATPPALVRMTYLEPEPKTVVMDGKSLTVVWPKRNEREQIDIRQTQKRIDKYFTNASVDDLRDSFDITAEPDAVMRRTDRVQMLPRRSQIKKGLEKLELWIDRETVLLVQMRMTLAGGDQKTIVLEDLTLDVPIGDDTFRP
jgi:outer membrane lipoprotein-sorting protein